MNLANDISDHVIFLQEGLIEEEGSAQEIFGNPNSKRLQQFLGATVLEK